MTETEIANNLARAKDAVATAAMKSGRSAEAVSILLATKTQPTTAIETALKAGYNLLGENRVQELVAKAPILQQKFAPDWHLIGQLQKNKINHALRYSSCIQSIDSIELAEAVAARWLSDAPFPVMLQVNTSAEASKSGCAPKEAIEVATRISEIPELRLTGLMTVGLNSPDLSAVARSYRALRELRDEVVKLPNLANFLELSMGMSADYEIAIAEGATMVRLGSSVFGAR